MGTETPSVIETNVKVITGIFSEVITSSENSRT